MQPLAEIETGRLAGLRATGGPSGRPVTRWHGIPYAAAPVGELRFRAPRPAESWPGVREATAFGPGPMQSTASPFSGVIPGNRVTAVSEDCLTLDVWAPDGPGPYPVLVWVPGGAYLTGATSIPTYDGARLAAEHDVVVVSVNYRLGVFGFGSFDTSELGDANCGLLDAMAALAWVRRNVAAFGGDPQRVTAFGESAGAGLLAHLLAAPASAGLADGYVLQSPGVDHTLYPDDAERVTAAVLAQLGLGRGELSRLRELPAAALVAAQEAVLPGLLGSLSAMPFHPVVDGEVLPASPSVAFAAGAAAGVPLVISWTAEEMRLYPNEAADAAGAAGVAEWARSYLTGRSGADPGPERARELVDFYRDLLGRQPGRGRLADVWAAIQTDGVMRLPARRLADSHAEAGGATYTAQFAWSGPAEPGQWDRGAFHAIDLPFTFGTLDTPETPDTPAGGVSWRQFLGAGPDADELCEHHLRGWAGFAATGEPRSPTGDRWPRYETDRRRTVVLDTDPHVADDPLGEIAQAWEGLWSSACRAPALNVG